MSRPFPALATAVLLAAFSPTVLAAQAAGSAAQAGRAPAPPADTVAPASTGGLRPLRIAKWSALLASTAAGIYGFLENARADDRYAELERLCETRNIECRNRTAEGAYGDPALEDLYQTVRLHDRRAHYALIAGQVGVAASVALFLLDLGNVRPPEDVPWAPGTVRLGRGPGELRLSVTLPVGSGRE